MKSEPVVFVVEDQYINQVLIESLLEELGYKVMIFASGIDALDALKSLCPDLIVLDLMMPLMDGFAFLEKLRANSRIPVLVVTAKTDIDSLKKAMHQGASDYIVKPFHTKDFTNKVVRLLM